MNEQEEQDMFITLVGSVKRADRLQRIWNDSYPHGTEYDRVFNKKAFKSKQQVFREKAREEGFLDREIEAFLRL